MKTIVLTGISCLLLAGVYGVMNKQSEVSKLLSFTQSNNATSPLSSEEADKATTNTLDDSHWIDDPLFEKAAASDLITDNETPEMAVPQPKTAQETIKQRVPNQGNEERVTEPTSEIKQLILELNPDTTIMNKVPVEVV
jgi:hypothetical protein